MNVAQSAVFRFQKSRRKMGAEPPSAYEKTKMGLLAEQLAGGAYLELAARLKRSPEEIKYYAAMLEGKDIKFNARGTLFGAIEKLLLAHADWVDLTCLPPANIAPLPALSKKLEVQLAVRGIIERSASKEEGAWEAAKDDWCRAYLAGDVSESNVDALLSRFPGRHLKIGSFAPTAEAMLDTLKELNEKELASISISEASFYEIQRFGKSSYHLKSSDYSEFYWVINEGRNYGIYPPDSKTDYGLVLRTVYMLGLPVSSKLKKSELNGLDWKIASALVDVLVYISQTGGGERLLGEDSATAKEQNSHMKYKCKREIAEFFVEWPFDGMIPKAILSYAERLVYS
jgi:hypothetical protein